MKKLYSISMKRKNLQNKNNSKNLEINFISKIFFSNKLIKENTMKIQNCLNYLEREKFADYTDELTTLKKYIPYYTPLNVKDSSTIKEILDDLSSILKREVTLQDPEYFTVSPYGEEEITFDPEDISLPYHEFLEKYELTDWHYEIFKDLIVIQQGYLESMPGLIYNLNEGPVKLK